MFGPQFTITIRNSRYTSETKTPLRYESAFTTILNFPVVKDVNEISPVAGLICPGTLLALSAVPGSGEVML
ncbi:MAG TPA: hypothetical protein DCD96_04395 [Flavobacteriales bacterium]|nr:hypothetical protein [Flavobacteriales bacterium]